MAMLEVKDINVYYGLIHALRDVSFTVNEGEVVALIGANGAGKTTLLRCISGILNPSWRRRREFRSLSWRQSYQTHTPIRHAFI